MPPERTAPITSALVWSARAYGALLTLALVLRACAQDRIPVLFALDSLLLSFFLPLPAVAILVTATRRRDLAVITVAGAATWLWLWGGLFRPRSPPPSGAPSIRVMSYNVLGFNHETDATVRAIRDADADVVALQELNPENAAAIESRLAGAYPYRWLDPRPGVTGGGILSRHSFHRLASPALSDMSWVGTPMTIELTLGDRSIKLVRFHAVSGPAHLHLRDDQARALAEHARALDGPAVFVGDLNATDQNAAYDILRGELRDGWREIGWGFGHTFPGRPTAATGGSRPVVLGIPVPLWLVRIDYVFHTHHLAAVDARVGPYDGASDHRPVVVTLALR